MSTRRALSATSKRKSAPLFQTAIASRLSSANKTSSPGTSLPAQYFIDDGGRRISSKTRSSSANNGGKVETVTNTRRPPFRPSIKSCLVWQLSTTQDKKGGS